MLSPTEEKNRKFVYRLGIFLVCLAVFGNIYFYFFYIKSIKSPNLPYKTGDIKKIASVYETPLPKINLFINNTQFEVEVAQTDAEKTLGLGNRDGLNDNAGMLFTFSTPSKQFFWMKDMRFSLDIIWIDANKKIVGFVENAKPEDYPAAYPSPDGVSYVLEVRSGEVKNRNIKIGDTAIFDVFSIKK